MYKQQDLATLNISSEFYNQMNEIEKILFINKTKELGFANFALWVNDENIYEDFPGIIFSYKNLSMSKNKNRDMFFTIIESNSYDKISGNLYIEIDIEKDSIERVLENVDGNKIMIVKILPFKISEENLAKYNDFCIDMDSRENVFLTKDNWKSNTLREHPCNIHACSGNYCHSNKKNNPKDIFIDKNGDVYPNGLPIDKYKLGNIYSNNLEMIISVDNTFTKNSRSVFKEQIFTYPYEYFPVNSFLWNWEN
ncbi:hypothetical protein [Listeria welshimeri]|uniref:hypothetical protein n=1 Tax=Listeria welshimeri TaxID=1643 RepID=UPI001889565C|nr:hypothetical protein [Listeria welshimeri]MBF2456547.1 hypothetical protein [Listeria welshimeri]MBF2568402.1 hypothetical protein [Listeria welshimeri]